MNQLDSSGRSGIEPQLAALKQVGDTVSDLVGNLGDEQWGWETPAPGWSIATQIGHLLWTDQVALQAMTDVDDFNKLLEEALQDPSGFVDKGAHRLAALPRNELFEQWNRERNLLHQALSSHDPAAKIAWFGPPMRPVSMARARIMETWAHGLDIADALGVRLDDAVALAHVGRIGFATRDFAFTVHGKQPPAEPFHLELTAPDGGIEAFGPVEAPHHITGSLRDFCMLVTQRVHRDDTDLHTGSDIAEEWLHIAQAFAGMPGPGREKGSRR